MKTNFSFIKASGALALVVAFGGMALVACSQSENPTPRDGGIKDGGVIVADTGFPKDGPAPSDTLTTPTDASGHTGGTTVGGFTGPNGCWQGPATKSNEALNACTDGTCTPFSNVDRLPLYNNGNLPQVP